MNSFEAYLWTRLDLFNNFFAGASFVSYICLIASIFFYIWAINEEKENYDYYHKLPEIHKLPLAKKCFYRSLITTIIFSSLVIFVPDKKDAATIYVLPKIANSEIVKQIPEDLNDIYKLGIQDIKDSLTNKETTEQKGKENE